MKEIKVTTNYEMFKKLEGNRDVSLKRVNKIKKSIEQVGYITSPILVNEKMEIIDGQGRYEALKELEMPIEYIIQDGISTKECIAMNIYQTNWSQEDYIKSYAKKGIQSYIYLEKLMNEFKELKRLEVYASALFEISKFPTNKVRDGLLEIDEEQYENAKEVLNFVYPIYKRFKNISRINLLIKGAIFAYKIPEIDIDRLKKKIIEMLEANKIPPIPTTDEAMQFIESIYNRKKVGATLFIYTEYRKKMEENLLKHAIKQRTINYDNI